MAKRRFPDSILSSIDSLIRAEALKARENPDPVARRRYADRGLQNPEIVTAVVPKAVPLLAQYNKELVQAYVSARVSQVLEGPGPERRVSAPLIPDLHLASEWLAIPPEDAGPDGWKKPEDATPNQVGRLIDRRRKRTLQENVETNKLVILRDTALEFGCDPDKPVSTVLGPGNKPRPKPEDRPVA